MIIILQACESHVIDAFVESMLISGQVSLARCCSSQEIRACGWWNFSLPTETLV